MLEARIGKPAVRQQALEDHIPVWYDRAVRDKAVDIINEAEIEVTAGKDDGALGLRRRGRGQAAAQAGRLRVPQGDRAQPGRRPKRTSRPRWTG